MGGTLLEGLDPGLAAMSTNAAAGFFLSGLALYLNSHGTAAAALWWRRGGRVCAGVVALLGLLAMVDYAGNAGIKPAAAACFLLVGLALLLDGDSRRTGRAVSALASAVAVVALTAGLNILYEVPGISGVDDPAWMSAGNAATFLALAAGVLCLLPDRGLIAQLRDPGQAGRVIRILLPAAVILQILLEYLNQAGVRAGLVESKFGVVLVDVVNIVVFAAMIVWVARSISRTDLRRKLAVAALQHERARLDAILKTASDGIHILDTDGLLVDASDAFLTMLGYDRTMIGRLQVTDWDAQLNATRIREIIRSLVAQQSTLLLETRHRRSDGRIIDVEVNCRAIRLDGQDFIYASSREITERKQVQERLRLADQVYQSASEGIAMTDIDGNIVAVNPAFEAITGYSQSEVLGKNPRLLQSGRQDQSFYRDMWASIQASGQWRGELWNRRKNGEVYPEWLSLSTVRDAQGRAMSYIGVFSDLSSAKAAQQQIEFLAQHDALTRLPNRALLMDRLSQALQRAQRESHPLALLCLGLDHFKKINETHGHSEGDGVLQEVARRLNGATRAGDTLARIGGDEFMLLLEGDVAARQVTVARKLLETLAAPLLIAGQEVALTASIGISLYPDDGSDRDTLLKQAEQAMQNAKAEGRNTYRYFDAALSAALLERLGMETALRGALAQGQLLLHYQPQVDLYSGEITGVEALLRWQHPDKGLLVASEFIGLAEDTDLILPIGVWALQTACRQLHAWHAAGYAGLRMSINISAMEFVRGRMEVTLAQVLRESGLDGRYLELELNESLILSDSDQTRDVLKQVKALGVGLAIDNFGIGNAVKHFPIDKLKIAKSVIGGVATNLKDAAIAQAIIAMGQGLRMKIVADGVETESQAGYLRTLHCDEMQGFHFSHALSAEEIPALLAAHSAPATSPAASGGRVLLLVDDEGNILSALKRLLRRDGYQILTAGSAEEGLEVLAQHQVGVLLSDQRMPGMNGTELLSRVKVMYPNIIRMILSGYTDVNSITESINRGEVYKFLTKPWDDESLRAVIKESFMRHETARDAE